MRRARKPKAFGDEENSPVKPSPTKSASRKRTFMFHSSWSTKRFQRYRSTAETPERSPTCSIGETSSAAALIATCCRPQMKQSTMQMRKAVRSIGFLVSGERTALFVFCISLSVCFSFACSSCGSPANGEAQSTASETVNLATNTACPKKNTLLLATQVRPEVSAGRSPLAFLPVRVIRLPH